MKLVKSFTVLASIVALSACGGNMYTPNYAQSYGYPNSYMQQGYNQYGQSQYSQYGQMGYAQNTMGGYTSQTTQTGYAQNQMGYQQTQMQNGYSQQMPQQQVQQAMQTGASQANPNGQQALPQQRTATSPTPRTTAPTAPRQALPPSAPKAPLQVKKANPTADFLAKARDAIGTVQGLTANVTVFEKGKSAGQGQIKLNFRQPGEIKIDILKSSDPGRNGVKLVYSSGGNEVRARASGVLSLVPLTLPMTDSKVKSGRGYLLNQIDVTATVKRLTQHLPQAKAIGKVKVGGSDVVIIEFTQTPGHFDPQITKERLGLDMQTFLPRIHEMYVGEELVYSGRLETLQVNPAFGPKDFEV